MFLRMPNARDRFMHAEVVPRERQPFASSSLSSPLLILPLWQVLLAYTGILI